MNLPSIINKIKHGIKWRAQHFYHSVIKIHINTLRAKFYAAKTRRDFMNYAKAPRHNLPGDVIVTLTSYPPRFGSLELTIKSLLLQDVSPDKVLLWVADHEKSQLPQAVCDLVADDRFEIRTCKDMGSYNKLIPALSLYPEAFLVTADDDLYYPKDWLSALLAEWVPNEKVIFAHRVHRVTMAGPNIPAPHDEWERLIGPENFSKYNFANTGMGMLFPPHSLDKRVFEDDVFLKLCPNADDIWFFWMGCLNGYAVRKTKYILTMTEWPGTQQVALFLQNVLNYKNDEKIKALINQYGWPIAG